MQVLTAEETLAAIQKATAPLVREIAILRRLVTENGDMVSTPEALRMTGIKDTRTLKNRISGWVQKGSGPITWPKAAIIEYLSNNAIAA